MSLFRQKGLIWRSSRLSRASLVRTSISGSTRAHISYAFDTTVVTEKFSMRCHNPLNVGPCFHHEGKRRQLGGSVVNLQAVQILLQDERRNVPGSIASLLVN